jgi:nicotinamidase-related amidase
MSKLAAMILIALCVFAISAEPQQKIDVLRLSARHRTAGSGSGDAGLVVDSIELDPHQTALVICDMWDRHWCKSATRRVAEMAPRINGLASALRARGVLIIHCPSDTMEYYKEYPGRKLAQAAPKIQTNIPLLNWCNLQSDREQKLPIDDSDGGCPDDPPCKQYKAWSHQIDTIQIQDGDAITDSAEAFYLMTQRGITNVLVCGVHENMCVLGRPFSIRQMVRQGQRVLLVRDLTDTMYNPKMPPHVDHFAGTDLMTQHIEMYWCSTITSDQVLGGKAFRFSEDRREAALQSPATKSD